MALSGGEHPPTGGHTPLARLLSLPARYPLTLLWAVLMLVVKSGIIERAPPAVASIVYATMAPFMWLRRRRISSS